MLNRELIREGFYWWYRKYVPGNAVLEGLEKKAREGRKGLWADPQPVPPWEWRRRSTCTARGGPAPSSPSSYTRPHNTAVVVQQSHEGIDQADQKDSTMSLSFILPSWTW
ncbi:MAG: hypothetical protein DMG05_26130 [Acidobacteria bacterium]|nr:MAG: hypothetical protein DMG05_26130 [Acidobacteriota bacterium]